MACGSSEAYITVFKPKHPGSDVDGPRIWNSQLLQYAAYRKEDAREEVMGDPKNVRPRCRILHLKLVAFSRIQLRFCINCRLHTQLRFTEMLKVRSR